ncbi:hypothetical protein ATANTOWER_020629 [Ataeniobius toweri]|uniref:Uncharacterized protein n=1 Tax=Ataeniobius toweri TaxID=208326 RepID=A0ABU7C687_9TELE|nr:hypothetical protein [Ataeniobius toweri]
MNFFSFRFSRKARRNIDQGGLGVSCPYMVFKGQSKRKHDRRVKDVGSGGLFSYKNPPGVSKVVDLSPDCG